MTDGIFFEFERDFAGSLRCIPMIVRQKLDLVKIKMTLRQWCRLPHEERQKLVQEGCNTPEEQGAFRALTLRLIEVYADEPVRWLEDVDYAVWQRPDACPADIQRQAEADHVSAPDAAAWAALTSLQRFVLVKLARSHHENMNFVPALREFGLL